MDMRPLGRTGLDIAPLVLGTNVFGWTADEATSHALLDAFVDAGLNAVDTADAYSRWVPGHQGGESETIIGKWIAKNPAKRDKLVIITKVGADVGQGKRDLSERWILEQVETSLRRLQVDAIDLYLSHWPDPTTPFEETLGAYDNLLKAGKIRSVGCSNLDAEGLREALEVAADKGLPRYEVLQPGYNLFDRDGLEGPLLDLCRAEGLGVITYFSLAMGFLSGKYRSQDDLEKSARGGGVSKYLTPRGFAILGALDSVGARHDAAPAEVALAWVMARPGITAPIASATSLDQLRSLVRATELRLSPDDIAELDAAGA
jgi:aryl-alcohol dehydrogenase-like predicted oxidoreductase